MVKNKKKCLWWKNFWIFFSAKIMLCVFKVSFRAKTSFFLKVLKFSIFFLTKPVGALRSLSHDWCDLKFWEDGPPTLTLKSEKKIEVLFSAKMTFFEELLFFCENLKEKKENKITLHFFSQGLKGMWFRDYFQDMRCCPELENMYVLGVNLYSIFFCSEIFPQGPEPRLIFSQSLFRTPSGIQEKKQIENP